MDADWLVLGHSTSEVTVYSSRTGELMRTLVGHQRGVWSVALVTRGGRPRAGANSEEERDSRSLLDSRMPYIGDRSDPSGASQGWGQRSSLVVSGGSDRAVMVWDVVTGQCSHRMQGHSSTIRCVKTLPNRPIAVSGSRDATLRVWDLNKGRIIRILSGHDEGISCLEVCGNRVASGSYDTTCRVWNVDTGECLSIMTGHQGRIYSLSFDGMRVASGSYDGTARVWNASTGELLQNLATSNAAVTNVLISPSSQLLACASTDGTVVVFSLSNYQVVRAVAPHQSSMTAIQFESENSSSEHHVLLTAGNDGWVRRFDVENGRFLKQFCAQSENVWKVVTRGDVCSVVCQRDGNMMVEIWSTKS